jgi:hypothetical protein
MAVTMKIVMWRREVWHIVANVSAERTASILRHKVMPYSVVDSCQCFRITPVTTYHATCCYSPTLKMGAVRSSETSTTIYRTTRRRLSTLKPQTTRYCDVCSYQPHHAELFFCPEDGVSVFPQIADKESIKWR